MTRRLVDLAVAIPALVLLAPLFVVIAAGIRLESSGNPFYGGLRAGRNGRPFRMWKFRTMVADADRVGPAITARRDSRVTRLGAFLRRSKIDELPQFFNLLTGSLTLVGPRAEVPGIVARYTEAQREVLSVKPGITGPGQLFYTTDQQDQIPDGVSPDDYYVEHLLDPKLRVDIEYIRRRTALTDIKVIATTVAHMIRSLAATPTAESRT